jgi:hypothetical protein
VRRSVLRIGAVLTPVLVLCIPSVFREVVNSIAYTANWISFQIGWDWHRISPHFAPERDILVISTAPTHGSVWLVLAVVGADVLALGLAPWMLRHGSSVRRARVRLFVGINAAVFCFFVLVLAVRVGLGYLS